MFTPSREECAWAAGFFDGEGHVGNSVGKFKGGTERRDLYIGISQVDRRVLDRFRAAVGCGKVVGPYVHRVMEQRGNEQPRYYYQTARCEHVQAVIAILWAWLSPVKREQARLALEHMRGHGNGQRRAKYWLTCKRGHPRTPENVRVVTFHGYECRRCVACDLERRQRRDLIRKTAVAMLAA